ncbi:hypothetical protein C8R45DRAFT_937008 [Mycena sanguinolenta]|nr:hypothetical protein C8R45DRAFT_937008 [Mycena sanguinolenta]
MREDGMNNTGHSGTSMVYHVKIVAEYVSAQTDDGRYQAIAIAYKGKTKRGSNHDRKLALIGNRSRGLVLIAKKRDDKNLGLDEMKTDIALVVKQGLGLNSVIRQRIRRWIHRISELQMSPTLSDTSPPKRVSLRTLLARLDFIELAGQSMVWSLNDKKHELDDTRSNCCCTTAGITYLCEFDVEQEKKMNGHILNIEQSEDFIDAAFTNCVNEETSTYRKRSRTTGHIHKLTRVKRKNVCLPPRQSWTDRRARENLVGDGELIAELRVEKGTAKSGRDRRIAVPIPH